MKKVGIILIAIISVFIISIPIFFYVISLDDGNIVTKEIDEPIPIIISEDHVYLISLQGTFSEGKIQRLQTIDDSIKYSLISGSKRQYEVDKDWNYKEAKEFIDISERNFFTISKIKIKGNFVVDDSYYNIISDEEGSHYLISSNDASFWGSPEDTW